MHILQGHMKLIFFHRLNLIIKSFPEQLLGKLLVDLFYAVVFNLEGRCSFSSFICLRPVLEPFETDSGAVINECELRNDPDPFSFLPFLSK